MATSNPQGGHARVVGRCTTARGDFVRRGKYSCIFSLLLLTCAVTMVVVGGAIPAFSQPGQQHVDTMWTRRYDGWNGAGDQPSSLAVDLQGNILVTGGSGVIIKYRSNGETAWVRTYANGCALDVTTDHDGDVYVTGAGNNWGNCVTIKYDSLGTVLWTKSFDYDNSPGWEMGREIIVDDLHYCYVKGECTVTYDSVCTYVLKYDSNGDLLRNETFACMRVVGEFAGRGFAFGPDRSIYATATNMSDSCCPLILAKYDTDLNHLWTRSFHWRSDTYDFSFGLAVDRLDNAIVTGGSCIIVDDSCRCYNSCCDTCLVLTLKYSPTGNLEWDRTYRPASGYTNGARGIGVVSDRMGNAYVSASDAGGLTTIKYSAYGGMLWIRTIPNAHNWGFDNGSGKCITIDKQDNVYVCGTSYSNGQHDYVVAKYSPDGNPEWVKYLDFARGTVVSDDWGMYIALDSQLNVCVTGTDSSVTREIGTAKLGRFGLLCGRVLYEDGTPVVGATVTANFGEPCDSCTTGSDGAYSITKLAAGQYIVQACIDRESDGSPVCNYYTGGNSAVAYAEIDVPSGAKVENIDIEFPLPTVLVHGWMAHADRWRGSKDYLESDPVSHDKGNGIRAHECFVVDNIGWRDHVSVSAANINTFIRNVISERYRDAPVPAFNIVAHSLGGVISRLYINDYSAHGAIRNLVMLGTPNAGLTLAGLWPFLSWFPPARFLSGEVSGDLTIPAMMKFNSLVTEDRDAVFHYFAGRVTTRNREAIPPLNTTEFTCTYPYTCSDGFIGEWSVFQCQSRTEYCLTCTNDVEPKHGALNDWPFIEDVALVLEGKEFVAPCGLGGCIGCQPQKSFARKATGLDQQISVTAVVADTMRGGNSREFAVVIDPTPWTSFSATWLAGVLRLTLRDPNGNLVDSTVAANAPGMSYSRDDEPGVFPHEDYTIDNPATGNWTLQIYAESVSGDSILPFLAFAALEGGMTLSGVTDKSSYNRSEPMILTASVRDGQSVLTGETLYAKIVTPEFVVDSIPFWDDGAHDDGLPSDGLFAAAYLNTGLAGQYAIYICAEGQTPEGDGFSRSVTSEIEVLSGAASCSGSFGDLGVDVDGDDLYDSLRIEVGVGVSTAGVYEILGVLKDDHGTAIDTARCYASGAVQPGSYVYDLDFDGYAIGRHAEDGPYFLTDLTIYETSQTIMRVAYLAEAYTTSTYAASQFPATCCRNRVGDANLSGEDEPTIGDVSTMIDAKFISGTCEGIILCLAEADINQSGGTNPTCDDITIGDISTLIDYLFITGSSLGLPNCL